MIAERIHPPPASQQQGSDGFPATAKYYQFSTLLEHVIDCFHTIVSDETNPYHPPLAWLTRKQPKPPDDELFLDLHDECSKPSSILASTVSSSDSIQLSASVRSRLERCPQQLRQEIVSRMRDDCSPLFMACKNGLTRVIKYLLDVCGADIEQRGRFEALEDHHVHSVTPLWVAAVSGHYDTVKLLIDRGASVNSISDTGSTPVRSVCFLCKDDDGLGGSDNWTEAVYSYADAVEDEQDDVYMRIVYLLAENGADLSKPNYNGGTCLINSLHSYRLAKYIIDHGANLNATDNQSKTALHYAIQTNRKEVVKLLLERGADPFLTTNTCDDALRLSCIGGHEDIFEHLIANYSYSPTQLADAYKLLGSSILEINYDIARVRRYWTKSLDLRNSIASQQQMQIQTYSVDRRENVCDKRRQRAFGDMAEIRSAHELQLLTVDEFRTQSLLISERILGPNHMETIQRLLYRGTFYINSLRPSRCLDLWIYALKLRIDHDSIFHFESVFSTRAIIELFLDLFSQNQHQQVRFSDVYDVLTLLVERLDECERHLSFRPRSCLHEDIYDLLLIMIVNLLTILQCVQRKPQESARAREIIQDLVKICPRTSKGSTLLHICVTTNMFEGQIYRSLQMASEALRATSGPEVALEHLSGGSPTVALIEANEQPRELVTSNLDDNQEIKKLDDARENSPPIVQLIENLLDAGLEVDQTNGDGLSAFQILCLATGISVTDKTKIIGQLVRRGAHIDRRALTPEQDEQIRQTLRECNIKPLEFLKLKCLAARKVSELGVKFDKTTLAGNLEAAIAIH